MSFSLLTYNIWSGKYWDGLLQFLKEQDADVFCLQEVSVYNTYHEESKDLNMLEQLPEAFPDHNLAYAPIGKRKIAEGKEESFGNAILTRFPITNSQTHYLLHPLQWNENHEEQSRNILETSLIVDKKPFTVVTGHLTYATGFSDTETQLKEAQRILEIVDGIAPLVFAGDYNSRMDSKVFRLLHGKMPVHDGAEEPTFAKHPFEYNGFRVDGLEYKIDHILATEDVRIADARVIDVPHSDHLPIRATIEIA